MVELADGGCIPEEPCKEFGPTARTIRNWITQTDQLRHKSVCDEPHRDLPSERTYGEGITE